MAGAAHEPCQGDSRRGKSPALQAPGSAYIRVPEGALFSLRSLGAEQPASIAHSALSSGLVTRPEDMAPEVRARLAAILLAAR